MHRALSLALLWAGLGLASAELVEPEPRAIDRDSPLGRSLAGAADPGDNVVAPLIAGGQRAAPGQFPYETYISNAGAACTGALIAPGWVITVRTDGEAKSLGPICHRAPTGYRDKRRTLMLNLL